MFLPCWWRNGGCFLPLSPYNGETSTKLHFLICNHKDWLLTWETCDFWFKPYFWYEDYCREQNLITCQKQRRKIQPLKFRGTPVINFRHCCLIVYFVDEGDTKRRGGVIVFQSFLEMMFNQVVLIFSLSFFYLNGINIWRWRKHTHTTRNNVELALINNS